MYLRAILALVFALFASPLWACNPVGMIGRSYSYTQQVPLQTYSAPVQTFTPQVQADPAPSCSMPTQSFAPVQTYFAPSQTYAAPIDPGIVYAPRPVYVPRAFNPVYVPRGLPIFRDPGYAARDLRFRGLPVRAVPVAAVAPATVVINQRGLINRAR